MDDLALWRIAHRLVTKGHARTASVIARAHRVLTGATIPPSVVIGEGTIIAYGGSGVVMNRLTVIGRNCLISPGVLLGSTQSHTIAPGAPTLGDGVHVYQNAVILGGVHIGAGAVVNAGAVVIRDVPAGAIVNPPLGRIVERRR